MSDLLQCARTSGRLNRLQTENDEEVIKYKEREETNYIYACIKKRLKIQHIETVQKSEIKTLIRQTNIQTDRRTNQ